MIDDVDDSFLTSLCSAVVKLSWFATQCWVLSVIIDIIEN